MIDVLHPSETDLDHSKHQAIGNGGSHSEGAVGQRDQDAEEAAWLESIESDELESVHMPQKGTLVMDIRSLRA